MSPEPQPWWVTPGKQILFRTVHLLQTNWKLYRPIFFITLITDQNFFTLSTKQLFVSSKDKTCSHQSNRNLTHTGQGHHLLTLALLLTSLLPCTESDVLCSWEGNRQFSKSIWIVHILDNKCFFRYINFQLHFWVLASWSEITQPLVWNYSALFSPYSTTWQRFFSLPFSITEFSRSASFWFYTEFQKAIIWI